MVCNQSGEVYKAAPKGMAWAPLPWEHQTLQLVCTKDDYQWIAAVVGVAKWQGIWTLEFGQSECYSILNPLVESIQRLTKIGIKNGRNSHVSSAWSRAQDILRNQDRYGGDDVLPSPLCSWALVSQDLLPGRSQRTCGLWINHQGLVWFRWTSNRVLMCILMAVVPPWWSKSGNS